jgi:hypothetical protein
MIRSLIILLLVFVSLVASDCPHEDGTLVSWNTASAWQSGQGDRFHSQTVIDEESITLIILYLNFHFTCFIANILNRKHYILNI